MLLPDRHRLVIRCVSALAAAGILLALSGCSSSGQLSQNASDAAAAAQTCALTLKVVVAGKAVFGVRDTALSDAMSKLQQDDTALTQADAHGQLSTLRDQVLRRVRTSEDNILKSQSLIARGAPSNSLSDLAARFAQTAKELTALEKKLEKQ